MFNRQYNTLDERVKLVNEYDRYMYRNYEVSGHTFHATAVVFDVKYEPFVFLVNTAITKDKIIIPLKVFDEIKDAEDARAGKTDAT